MNFKKLICNMLDCTVASKPKPNKPLSSKAKIALVVGHNAKSQGAVNYRDETEFEFNSRIAKKLSKFLDNSIVLYRPAGKSYYAQCKAVAKECQKEGVDLAICLHFNSYDGSVQGCEALILDTKDPLDNKVASCIMDSIADGYGFKNRGVKTVGSGHRGSGMLMQLKEVGVVPVLIEPMFADNKESAVIFNDETRYVNTLYHAILRGVSA